MKIITQSRIFCSRFLFILFLSLPCVFLLPAYSKETDSPFQDLKLGYLSDKVSRIIDRLLPKICTQKHEEIKFENSESYFSVYFDERGRLSRVERTQKEIAKTSPDAEFRAIANKYKCDNFAMTMSIGSDNSISYVKSGSVSQKNSSFYENRELGFLQINLSRKLNKDRNYISICKMRSEINRDDVRYLCMLSTLFCPSKPNVHFGSGRF